MSALLVTGVGMVTSLGDTATAAAAYRAGLARPSRWSWEASGDGDLDGRDDASAWITGHRVRPSSLGFEQASLWLRMALGAFDDLRAPTESTLVLMALPSPDPVRFGWASAPPLASLTERLLRPFLEAAGIPASAGGTPQLFTGPRGFVEALGAAETVLTRHLCRRALIVTADALTDDPTLRWLDRQGRLKHGDRAVGLIPGEGAVCIALEREHPEKHRDDMLFVEGWQSSAPAGTSTAIPTAAELGQQLAAALTSALPSTGARRRCDLYLDLNGETWKSEAWGHALHHLASSDAELAEHWRRHAHLPVAAFGDMGIAHAPLSLGLAERAWTRRYARAEHALVASISREGLVTAMALRSSATRATRGDDAGPKARDLA